MGRRYVSDIVGNAFENWKEGDQILITTPTGSGKTTFILKTLLKHAKDLNRHIVYFCNRRLLNFQLQSNVQRELLDELGEDKEGLSSYFHIRTYQHAEIYGDYPDIRAVDENGKIQRSVCEIRACDVLYYIFDEAHYFVEDAAFNSHTKYWYDMKYHLAHCRGGVSVFLTATPEPLYLFLSAMQGELEELKPLCEGFIAKYFVGKNVHQEHWVRFLSPVYRWLSDSSLDYGETRFEREETKAQYYNQVVGECASPCRDLFAAVRSAYDSEGCGINYRYHAEKEPAEYYQYIAEYYFSEIAELGEPIIRSVKDGGKWMVFVRTVADAHSLQAILQSGECDSVIITSKSARDYAGNTVKRRSKLRKALDGLVRQQTLVYPVLIATSVLDCGVSLHADDVNNIVICQPNKTSFLQMLGRIRVKEGDRINLFVQSYSPNQIKGYIQQYRNEFVLLVQLYLKDDMEPKESFYMIDTNAYYAQTHTLPDVPFLENTGWLSHALWDNYELLKYMTSKKNNNDCSSGGKDLSNLCVNELALLNHMGMLYFAETELPENKEPYYFLKKQLSWIGKEYDPNRWTGQKKRLKELRTYLEGLCDSQQWLDKEDQCQLRKTCFILLSRLHDMPGSFEQIKGRYDVKKGVLPGKKVFNAAFQQIEIPFEIVSRQPKFPIYDKETNLKIGIDHKTYWKIVKVPPDPPGNNCADGRESV